MTTERFVELANGLDQYEVQRYSGRAMYGARCPGIVVSDLGHGFVAEMMLEAEDEREQQDLIRIFRRTKSDNMGLDMIIYWPDLTWPVNLNDTA